MSKKFKFIPSKHKVNIRHRVKQVDAALNILMSNEDVILSSKVSPQMNFSFISVYSESSLEEAEVLIPKYMETLIPSLIKNKHALCDFLNFVSESYHLGLSHGETKGKSEFSRTLNSLLNYKDDNEGKF